METIQKTTFILFLFSVNLLAAGFMINESASYYTMLYAAHDELKNPYNQIYVPWVAAILAEIFQHAMMIMTDAKRSIVWFFRILAGALFVITVIAAGYRVLKPIELAAIKDRYQNLLVDVLKDEVKFNLSDRDAFESTQQLNKAISVLERRKSSKELKETLKSFNDSMITTVSYFETLQIILLRIAIQLSALTCAWKIGSIYRTRQKKINKILRVWRVPGEISFVGIAQTHDGTFISAIRNNRGHYKTFRGALNFFNGTKYAGKIPLESREN